jgi:hypothetical protein
MARAGTTALARGLRTLDGVYVFPYEAGFDQTYERLAYFLRFRNRFSGLQRWVERHTHQVRYRVANDPDSSAVDWAVFNNYSESLINACSGAAACTTLDLNDSYQALMSSFFEFACRESGCAIVAEKTPGYVSPQHRHRLGPNVLTVLCVRDAASVLESGLRRGLEATEYERAGFSADLHNELARLSGDLFLAAQAISTSRADCLLLNFEALALAPRSVCSALSVATGQPWSGSTLNRFHEVCGATDVAKPSVLAQAWASTLHTWCGVLGYDYSQSRAFLPVDEGLNGVPLFGTFPPQHGGFWVSERFAYMLTSKAPAAALQLVLSVDDSALNHRGFVVTCEGVSCAVSHALDGSVMRVTVQIPEQFTDIRPLVFIFFGDTAVSCLLSASETADERMLFNFVQHIDVL